MAESYLIDIDKIPARINWSAHIIRRLKEMETPFCKGIVFILRPHENKAGLVKEWYRICKERGEVGMTCTKKHQLGRTIYLYTESSVVRKINGRELEKRKK